MFFTVQLLSLLLKCYEDHFKKCKEISFFSFNWFTLKNLLLKLVCTHSVPFNTFLELWYNWKEMKRRKTTFELDRKCLTNQIILAKRIYFYDMTKCHFCHFRFISFKKSFQLIILMIFFLNRSFLCCFLISYEIKIVYFWWLIG